MVKEDVSLPKAAVQKLVKSALPARVKMNSGEVSATVGALTKGKKTLTNAHFYSALQSLGFQSCLEEVKRSVAEFEQSRQSRPSLAPTKSVEELEAEQKRLFEEAQMQFKEAKPEVVVRPDTDDYDK